MEKYQKSNRDSRKNKEKSKTSKYFGSQKHVRLQVEKCKNLKKNEK